MARYLFTVVLYAIEDGVQRDYILVCDASEADGLVVKLKPYTFNCGGIFLSGDPAITSGLRKYGDAAFGEILKDMDIYNMITQPMSCRMGMKSVPESVAICRFINQVCGKKAHEVTGEVSTISESCDVLILDNGGVHPA